MLPFCCMCTHMSSTHLNYIMEQCSHIQIIIRVPCYYMHYGVCTEQRATKIKQLSLNNTPFLDTHTQHTQSHTGSFCHLKMNILSRYIEFNLKLCSKFFSQKKETGDRHHDIRLSFKEFIFALDVLFTFGVVNWFLQVWGDELIEFGN